MSQHYCTTTANGRAVRVLAGYDRPLRELFLHVFVASGRSQDKLLYASLHEPQRDWTDPQTLIDKLVELQVAVPDSFVPAIVADQRAGAGNKIVVHYFDRPPDVTLF